MPQNGRIPPEEYKTCYGNIQYITIDQIKEFHTDDEIKNWEEFFHGQTGVIAENGGFGIYIYDYERWIGKRMLNKQTGAWD